jgi:alpha-1,6-mannosyltransferase
VVTTAVLTLCCAWVAGSWLILRDRWPTRAVAGVAALWCLPFALVPPALSQDAYAYLAQGAAASTAGASSYRAPDAALGAGSPLLHAVDPLYRSRISPYGPVAIRMFAACVSVGRGHAVIALIALRVLVVLCIVAGAMCAYRIAPPERRSLVVWLVAASPLVALHLVGGLHLEALLAGLIAGALLLHARGATTWAAVLVVVAAEVKVTAGVALLALLVSSWSLSGWRGVRRDVAAAGAAVAALTLILQPAPFGWLGALSSTLNVWNPISLPTVVALTWAEVTRTSPFVALGLLRAAFLGVGLVLVVVACLSHRRRPTTATAGLLLAAVTFTGPMLWPWYVVPCAICLCLTGERTGVVAGTAVTVGAALSGLPMPMVQMQRVSVAGALSVLALCAVVLSRTMQAGPEPLNRAA